MGLSIELLEWLHDTTASFPQIEGSKREQTGDHLPFMTESQKLHTLISPYSTQWRQVTESSPHSERTMNFLLKRGVSDDLWTYVKVFQTSLISAQLPYILRPLPWPPKLSPLLALNITTAMITWAPLAPWNLEKKAHVPQRDLQGSPSFCWKLFQNLSFTLLPPYKQSTYILTSMLLIISSISRPRICRSYSKSFPCPVSRPTNLAGPREAGHRTYFSTLQLWPQLCALLWSGRCQMWESSCMCLLVCLPWLWEQLSLCSCCPSAWAPERTHTHMHTRVHVCARARIHLHRGAKPQWSPAGVSWSAENI